MTFVLRILFIILFLIVEGLALYYLGGFLYYKTKYKKLGHHIVAVSGFYSSWLPRHCPYTPGTCRIWNCPNFHQCGGDNDVI